MKPRIDPKNLDPKLGDMWIEQADGTAHTLLHSKYRHVSKQHWPLVADGSEAFGIGCFKELKERQGALSIYTDEELEYSLHRKLQLADLTPLFGMRFNLLKLKDKLPELVAKHNNGDPEVVATMADGTQLHTFMFDKVVDPHTAASCTWIRNKIAEVIGAFKPNRINKLRV